MSSLNKVMLIGNLGKDPEARYFDSGVNKTTFSLATSEKYTNKEGQVIEQTEWHNIVLWRGLAKTAETYLRKGSKVFIEGRIRTRSWDDENGVKKYITEIEGRSMVMLGSRGEGQAMGSQMQQVARAEQLNEPALTTTTAANNNGAANKPSAPPAPPAADDEDDLPF